MSFDRIKSQEVIDLVSSSPFHPSPDPHNKAPSMGASSRVTTPTFTAFRERWLNFDCISRHDSRLGQERTNASLEQESPSTRPSQRSNISELAQKPASIVQLSSSPEPALRVLEAPPDCNPFSAASASIKMKPEGRLPSSRKRTLFPAEKENVTILLDRTSFANYQAHFDTAESCIQIRPADLFHKNSIIWRPSSSHPSHDGEKDVAMLMFEARTVYEAVNALAEENPIAELLFRWQYDIPEAYEKVHILIIGGKSLDYRLQSEINKDFRAAVISGQRLQQASRLPPKEKSWSQIEQALWINALKFGFHFHHLDKPDKLPAFLKSFTAQVIKRFTSLGELSNSNFCLSKAKRCASTFHSIWEGFLGEINRVTPNVAQAIVDKFPTASSLLSEYATLDREEAELLLADLVVNGRRLGPAVSRRVYHTLACQDGDAMANG